MDVKSILILEDHEGMRKALKFVLKQKGYDVTSFRAIPEALSYFKGQQDYPGIVLTDLRICPDKMAGLHFLQKVLQTDGKIPVIFLTAQGTVDSAVKAMKQGAFDFIEKSKEGGLDNADALIRVVERACQERRVELEYRALRRRTLDGIRGELVGRTPQMKELQQTIMQLAPTPLDVIIVGENGTGKEVVANCLHRFSDRQGGPFEELNCARPEAGTFESTLFGHELGAFTGAVNMHKGYLERANGGTLFMDELESMPVSLQAKLLRALQERRFIRLGGQREIQIDVRVVAAVKIAPEELVSAGLLRQDLYYRLAGMVLKLPPLRARVDDIPLLWQHFMLQLKDKDETAPEISPSELAQLALHTWPGNVRELKHVAARFFYMGPENAFPSLKDSENDVPEHDGKDLLTAQIDAFVRRLLIDILQAHGGNISKSAKAVGMPRKTFEYRIHKHGLTEWVAKLQKKQRNPCTNQNPEDSP